VIFSDGGLLPTIGVPEYAGLEPYAYLSYVLKALPYADTLEQIEALLPWNLKK